MRQQIDADAEHAQHADLLEHGDIEALAFERERGGEPADAAAADADLHELSAAAFANRFPTINGSSAPFLNGRSKNRGGLSGSETTIWLGHLVSQRSASVGEIIVVHARVRQALIVRESRLADKPRLVSRG
jgi:hypothetical protein